LVVLFSVVASTDSLYFHTYKYRLHLRPQSRHEHFLHTANICLFVPQVYLMFCVRPQGLWLWAAMAVCAATFVIELFDVLCENDSRRDLGGLVPAEYAMHFSMSALRSGYVFAYFAGTSWAQYTGNSQLAPVGLFSQVVGWTMVIPGLAVAAMHLWLCRPLKNLPLPLPLPLPAQKTN
jgi:hypothetical protein